MRKDLTKIIQNEQTYLLVKEVAKVFKCTATTLKKNLIKQNIGVHNLENFGRSAFVLEVDLENFTYKHRTLEIESNTEVIEGLETLENTIKEIEIRQGNRIGNEKRSQFSGCTEREELLSSLLQSNLISFNDYKKIIIKEKMNLFMYATKELTLEELDRSNIYFYNFQHYVGKDEDDVFGVVNTNQFNYKKIESTANNFTSIEDYADYLENHKTEKDKITVATTFDEEGQQIFCIYINRILEGHFKCESGADKKIERLSEYINLDYKTEVEPILIEQCKKFEQYIKRSNIRFLEVEKARKEKLRKEEEEKAKRDREYEEQYRKYSDYNFSTVTSTYNNDEKKMLKQMYKNMAIKCHPDRGGNVRDMQVLNSLKTKLAI